METLLNNRRGGGGRNPLIENILGTCCAKKSGEISKICHYEEPKGFGDEVIQPIKPAYSKSWIATFTSFARNDMLRANHRNHLFTKKKAAFTLAEVLITLGVIGVVASMTIPTLIQEHKKSVVANKLKKASSSLMQAYNLSIAEYGDSALEGNREGFTANDPDSALEMFNKYYVPYIKFLKVEKGEKGVFGYMTDGTVLYFRKTGFPKSWSNTYIIVCIDAKACQNMPEEGSISKSVNGKNTFGLYVIGKVPTYILSRSTREERINMCANGTGVEACTELIFEAGWKVPDDYPIRL